ncbi:hypothetical protein AB0K00_52445 [Dactylosporangium sp. NPDC049525]|uniref:hypothetical protein n=1 Tax=Dactylosporangium sp. NPDC049525 TaxID=3154730 RepID=UPI0034248326
MLFLLFGGGLLAGYVGWAARRAHPVVDLAMLRTAQPALALGLSVLASTVTFAVVFLLPVFTEAVQGRSAFGMGLALLPQGIITVLGTVLAGRFVDRRRGSYNGRHRLRPAGRNDRRPANADRVDTAVSHCWNPLRARSLPAS